MDALTDDLKGFGSFGTDDGQMVWPVQIITDVGGNVYVSDEATHRITKFDQEGEFVSKWGVHGDQEGEFDGPTGISFDSEGNLVVVDSKNHRVQKYTADGAYLGGFGSHGSAPGQFDLPWGVHIDELGDIYVADWGNNRFQVFSTDGDLKLAVGKLGSGEGEFKPTDRGSRSTPTATSTSRTGGTTGSRCSTPRANISTASAAMLRCPESRDST